MCLFLEPGWAATWTLLGLWPPKQGPNIAQPGLPAPLGQSGPQLFAQILHKFPILFYKFNSEF